ncbi:HtaA domain-containing protein, partial [Conexibacter sp. CPCC 205706]|uniref:HtaA domain-containing protein n=1 Tax=Conexibacter sp. CPCC 205706 TaxID=3064572 RepID=UPI00271CF011
MVVPNRSAVARTRRLLVAVALVAVALAATALAGAPPASAAPTEITSGSLDWGVRASFRSYVGDAGITVADGATRAADGGFRFPLTGGSYDADSRDTDVRFGGSVRFWSHGGLLDLTIARLRVVTTADGATLRADVVSRELGGTAELKRYDDLALATLDEPAATVSYEDGATSWRALPATLTAAAVPAFAGFYAAGAVLDPLAIDYAGPGGKHAEEVERWTAPGSPAATLGSTTIPLATGTGTETTQSLFAGAGGQAVVPRAQNVSTPDGTEGRSWLDVIEGGAVAQRLRMPLGFPSSGWSYDVAPGQLAVGPQSGTLVATASRISDGSPAASRTGVLILARGSDGRYPQPTTADAFALPQLSYQNAGGTTVRRLALLSDVAIDDQTQTAYALTDRGSLFAFDHDALGWHLRANVTALPGTSEADSSSSPRRLLVDQQAGLLHAWNGAGSRLTLVTYDLRAGGEPTLVGQLALGGSYSASGQPAAIDRVSGVIYLALTPTGASAPVVVALDGRASGGARTLGEPIAVAPQQGLAVDQADGRVYATTADRRVVVIDGRPAADAARTAGEPVTIENTRSPWFVVPTSDRIYLYSFGSANTTIETLERAASPSLTSAPADATAALAAVEASGSASFAVVAAGTPAAAIQWQRRAADATRWTTLDGATSARLDVTATVADDGARYRAVLTNAAGRLASEPVTLTVTTPPAVLAQPEDVTVAAGSDAVLKTMPTGHPYPQIQWERLDGATWVDLPGATTGFLTLPAVDTALSGTRYRARLTNARGTVHTAVATLTVTRTLTQPVTFAGGHVDWGIAERWRCYVVGTVARGAIEVSGGIEKIPGTLATGGLCNGRNAGSEQLRWPVTSGSYDPASGRLELALGGSVRFWGHDYHTPGDTTPLLDTRIGNLKIVVENGVGTLYADASGATMDDPLPKSWTQVALVSFALAGGPGVGESGVSWAPAETALTAAGAPVFGSYAEGEAFDALTIAPQFGTPLEEQPPVVAPPGEQPPAGQPAPPAAPPAAGVKPPAARAA